MKVSKPGILKSARRFKIFNTGLMSFPLASHTSYKNRRPSSFEKLRMKSAFSKNQYLVLLLGQKLSSHVPYPYQVPTLLPPKPPHRQCLPTHPQQAPGVGLREGIMLAYFFLATFSPYLRRITSNLL
jgi:hypothetical protein